MTFWRWTVHGLPTWWACHWIGWRSRLKPHSYTLTAVLTNGAPGIPVPFSFCRRFCSTVEASQRRIGPFLITRYRDP